MAAEFTPINTQEEYQQRFNSDLGDRLRKNEEKWQKKYEGYISPEELESQKKDLESRMAELNGALESANTKVGELEKNLMEKESTLRNYESSALKHKVAHEIGLGYDAISFLQGEDEESIMESAQALKGLIGSSSTPVPAFGSEPKVNNYDMAKSAYSEMAKALSGQN